jgi:hypothetical protein
MTEYNPTKINLLTRCWLENAVGETIKLHWRLFRDMSNINNIYNIYYLIYPFPLGDKVCSMIDTM